MGAKKKPATVSIGASLVENSKIPDISDQFGSKLITALENQFEAGRRLQQQMRSTGVRGGIGS